VPVKLDDLPNAAQRLLENRARFVSIFVTGKPIRSLVAAFAFRGEIVALRAPLNGNTYSALSSLTRAAELPERELRDVGDVLPLREPALEPVLRPDANDFRRRVEGEEAFVIPYGPIRSGIFESIQYVIDTGGEDVLAIETRPFFKHRALEQRFRGLSIEHGAALAARISGPASVAHAIAFAEAVEHAAGVDPPALVHAWRVVHAELERIAAHLDVATRLAEDAALSVGVARFGILKEDVMRLRASISGSRFARDTVVPGRVGVPSSLAATDILAALRSFEREFARDSKLLVETASFTDRLIGSGTLDRETIDAYGGVGPVARACSVAVDARFERPYGAYRHLGLRIASADSGDAMARLVVRFEEVETSLHLIRQALRPRRRNHSGHGDLLPDVTGAAFGWAEAPMGEVAYWLELERGRIGRAHIVSPSLRNWPLFAASFRGDVLTDFSFIEHSFGLSPAGSDR
jgi:Ni,Fe-hydrogenase III large subunit